MYASNGDIFHYSQFDKADCTQFPTRNHLIHNQFSEMEAHTIKSGKPFLFMPNDIDDYSYTNYGKEYRLVMSGITMSGYKVIVSVRHKPYFYIRVPDSKIGIDIFDSSSDTKIDKAEIGKFVLYIKNLFAQNPLLNSGNEVYSLTETRFYRAVGIQLVKGVYYRAEFKSLKLRNMALDIIERNSEFIETALDERSNYHMIISRELGINLTGWNLISNYKLHTIVNIENEKNYVYRMYGFVNASFIIDNNFADNDSISVKSIDLLSENCKVYESTIAAFKSSLLTDRSIMLGFDIECRADDGMFPVYTNDKNTLFMIGITIAYHHNENVLLSIVLTCYKTNPLPNAIVVECKSEKDLLLAFAKIIGIIQPEFIFGFNDGTFDWHYVTGRCLRYNILEDFKSFASVIYKKPDSSYIKKRIDDNFEKNRDKYARFANVDPTDDNLKLSRMMVGSNFELDASNSLWNNAPRSYIKTGYVMYSAKLTPEITLKYHCLKFFGYLNIDVMVALRVKNGNPEKYKLNHFLVRYNLKVKEDMAYDRMFGIIREYVSHAESGNILDSDINDMTEVAKYCLYDSEACHLLLNKIKYIPDNRSVGSMSYVSMDDCIHRADGVKVQNLVSYEASKRGYLFTSRFHNNKGINYSGGYVVDPERGVNTPKLTIQERVENYDFEFQNYTTRELSTQLRNEMISHSCDLDDSYKKINDCIVTALKQFITIAKLRVNDKIKIKLITMAILRDTDEKIIQKIKNAMTLLGFNETLQNLISGVWLEKTGRPCAALDFSGLYPSLMMAYNLSPETVMRKTPESIINANKLIASGVNLRTAVYDYIEDSVTKEIEVFIYKHSYEPNNPNANQIKDNFGIFPSIQYELKKDRKFVKDEISRITKTELKECQTKLKNTTISTERDLLNERLSEINFRLSYLNSRQYAIKIFMNTFYGESGNPLSKLHMLEIAGAITSYGRYNLKLSIQILNSTGFKVLYGDTDSAYFKCLDKYFRPLDMLYYGGIISKEKYCAAQVSLQIKLAGVAATYVNGILRKDNGTGFLTMAYEEVLYPVTFLEMKTYNGVAHTTEPNFDVTDEEHIFKRGGKTRQKGIPKVLLSLCDDVIPASLDITKSHLSIVTHVEEAIRKYFTTAWDISYFTKSYTYNPKKKNVTVVKFVERMRQKGIEIAAGSRFEAVHVKPSKSLYNIKGVKETSYVGDLIEFPSMVDNINYFIDLEKYYDGTIAGQFASFCSSHPSFNTGDRTPLINAREYIDSIADRYLDDYKTDHRFHKQIYKHTTEHAKRVVERLQSKRPVCTIKELEKIVSDNIESTKHETIEFAKFYIKESRNFVKIDWLKREIDYISRYINLQYVKFADETRNLTFDNTDIKLDVDKIIAETIQKFRVTLSTTDDNDAGHKKFQSSISNIINDTIASNLGDKKTVLYIGETVENIRNAGIIKDQYETILHLITVNKKVEKMRFIQEFKNEAKKIHQSEVIDFSEINL